MTRNRPAVPALVLALLLSLPAVVVEASEVATVLGPDGQLLSLLDGTYGEMVPDGVEAQAAEPVLALRSTLADGRSELRVIPATLSQNSEQSAEMVYEPESGTTFVFWQSWTSPIQNRLLVSGFDGETWSEPIEVSGPAFAWRTSPAFAVTRDSFDDVLADEGEAAAVSRTILHVLWSEEGSDGRWSTKYAPLILLNGQYIGNHPVVVLEDLLGAPDAASGAALPASPPLAPVLRPQGGDNSVVAAFQDARTRQVVSLELRFAAGELSLLGDAVAAEIDRVGPSLDLATPEGTDRLVGTVSDLLGRYEHRLKSEILDPLAGSLAIYLRELLESGEADVKTIGNRARVQMVDVGFRLTDGRVNKVYGITRVQMVDVGARVDGGGGPGVRHDVRSSVASQRVLPPEAPHDARVLVSIKGQRQILAWQEDGRVLYRESRGNGGWNPVQGLHLNESFGYRQAMDLLQQRVDQK